MNRAALTHLLSKCGQPSAGKKELLATRLSKHLSPYRHLESPGSVFSIDVGVSNIAFVLLDAKYSVQLWQKHSVELEDDEKSSLVLAVRGFVTSKILTLLEKHKCENVIIERQRFYNGGRFQVPFSIARINMVELMLYSELTRIPTLSIEAVSPSMVASHFSVNASLDAINKKKRCTLICNGLLTKIKNKRLVKCPTRLLTRYQEEKKKDDLADCLVNAVAWMDWKWNSISLANDDELLKGRADQLALRIQHI